MSYSEELEPHAVDRRHYAQPWSRDWADANARLHALLAPRRRVPAWVVDLGAAVVMAGLIVGPLV